MKKWIFVLSLILSFNTKASNDCGDDLNINCWDCGKTQSDNCTARLDGTKLTITSTNNSQMKDYNYFDENQKAPWGNNATSADINGVSNIGNFAFKYATNLTEVNISDSVKEIGLQSFDESSLKNLVLPDNLQKIGNYAFSSRSMTAEEIIIPNSVTTIGERAFQDNLGVKSIVIGDNVTSIGAGAFTRVNDRTVIYCENNEKRSCESLIAQNNSEAIIRLKTYTTDKNGYIHFKGKIYESLNDLPKYIKRRIYTIEEANFVAGDKNRVSITYR